MTPADLLDRTADVIEERGHCKHLLTNDEGAVCLMGGMNVVQNGDPCVWHWGLSDLQNTRLAAHAALMAEVDAPDGSFDMPMWQQDEERLVNWNNLDGRTQGEVVDKLRHAAKRLRGGA